MAKIRAGFLSLVLLLVSLVWPGSVFCQDPKIENTPETNGPAWGENSSYIIPAVEIVGFDALLNRYNRWVAPGGPYNTTFSSIGTNLRSRWVVDGDPFKINQLFHPYQGSMYFGFARSSGNGFWKSAAYTFAGSALWEIAGETTPPSRNDQVASGIGGVFLGEPLFRIANLMLERGGHGGPRFGRQLGAAVISPATEFNRMAFGGRFDEVFPSHDPIHYSRLFLGMATTTPNDAGSSPKAKQNEALADFSMDYGLPGKDGYSYKRPFDYFNFQVIASSANGVESLMTRGLLVGSGYDVGKSYHGVWGLYGNYDYLAPQLFRVSTTALSVGTTAEWKLANRLELQGTGLAGAGYAAVGSVSSANANDNHYGVAPQSTLALRLIFGSRASLDLGAHEYFVSSLGGAGRGGRDNIARAGAAVTVRIHQRHGITIKYLMTRRDDVTLPKVGDRTQTKGTLGLFYTLLGHDGFGSVDWSNRGNGIH